MSLAVESRQTSGGTGYSPGGTFTRRLGVIAAAATFLMLLAMTIGAALGVRAVLNSQSEQRFADMVEGASNSVLTDLEHSFTEMAALEGFFRSELELTNNKFEIFASTLNQRVTGSESVGFAPRVSRNGAETFAETMRAQGIELPAFDPQTVIAETYPIAFMFPPIQGLVEAGENLVADPRFGTAVRESLRNRAPVASGVTTLRTNQSSQPRFFVFEPVFGDPEPGKHPSEGPLIGYAFAVYRAADFLAGPLARNSLGGVPLRVFDTAPGRPSSLIFPELDSEADGSLASGWVQASLDFAGRRWDLQFETPEQFGLSTLERNVWIIVLSAGLGLTVFASISMFSLLKARSAAHSDLDLKTSQMRVIVGSAIEGIVVLDAQDRLILANQSFAKAFGMPDPDLLANKDWSAVRESAAVEFDDRELFFETLARLNYSRDSAVAALDIRIKSPVARTLSMSSSPVNDASGRYLGRLFVFRDVSAERSADEAKTDFISMVSHELRTPLTSIVGYVDLLLEEAGGEHSPESSRLLKVVRRNSNRLARLVADILDLSRIDNARFDLEPSDVDVSSLITELVESMSADFKEKNQDITMILPAGLPTIFVDRIRIGQVFTNLLSNAHRYTPSGGYISVKAFSDDENLTVVLKDTGVGISRDDQSRMFERFARINRKEQRQAGSTGLGLAITKALVELHGGTVSVVSSQGKGSEFTVTIPHRSNERNAA